MICVKCGFCKEEIPKGTGVMYVKRDGSVTNFCGNKCRKHKLKLGRNPRKLKWVKKGI